MKKGQLPGWLSSKEPTASAGDKGDGFDPGLGSPGEGHDNPLQCLCLKNPMNRGAWQATQSIGLQRVGHD